MKVIMPTQGNLDLNGDGKVTIDELAKSTGSVFAQLVVVFGALGGAVWLVVVGPLFFKIAGAVIGLAAICSFGLGVYRMLRYERMESRDKIAWHLEHERARWEFDQAKGISKEASATSLSQAQVDMAAQNILARYYSGKEWSREAMVKDNLLTAELWNEANAVLQKRRIRKGRKRELEPENFADAWGIYCEAKLRQNRHKLANNDWREAD